MTLVVPTALGDVAVHLHGRDPSTAPGLLLLHANPGDARDFDQVVPDLSRDHAVAVLDWPGFGESTVADPHAVTAVGLVDVAEQVLDELASRGFDRLAVIGNSVGGFVAMRLAERRREVAAVVLVNPAGFAPPNLPMRAFCSVMAKPSFARRAVRPLARLYLGKRSADGVRAAYLRVRELRADQRRLAVYCSLWQSFADPRVYLGSARVATDVPVQVLWGMRDVINPYPLNKRALSVALPDAAVVRLPAAHEVFAERPELFLARVRPFLAALTGV